MSGAIADRLDANSCRIDKLYIKITGGILDITRSQAKTGS